MPLDLAGPGQSPDLASAVIVTNLVKRSFSLAGHRTSVALEPEFWAVLARLAVAERVTLAGLVARLDGQRSTEQPLASMLRVYALTERF